MRNQMNINNGSIDRCLQLATVDKVFSHRRFVKLAKQKILNRQRILFRDWWGVPGC